MYDIGRCTVLGVQVFFSEITREKGLLLKHPLIRARSTFCPLLTGRGYFFGGRNALIML